MSIVQMEAAGQDALDRASRLLAGIEGGLDKAVRSAVARSVTHLRSSSTKAIRERYAISTANIRANENVKVRYSYQNGVQATVTYAGVKIPLYRYDGVSPKLPGQDTSKSVRAMIDEQWKTIHPSLPAYGHQLNGTAPAHLQDAFVAQMKSGHIGIFERTGDTAGNGREEIREIMGSSVPQMIGSPEVENTLATQTLQKFEERLDHEVNAILNGWR